MLETTLAVAAAAFGLTMALGAVLQMRQMLRRATGFGAYVAVAAFVRMLPVAPLSPSRRRTG